MSLTRKELDIVYKKVYSLYQRKERDNFIRIGINILYQALLNYIDGEKIERESITKN